MDFGAIAGPILGAAVGGIFGNKAAKYQAGASDYAVNQQMRPYNLVEPYFRDLYSDAAAANRDALSAGAYTGSTYAGLNDLQREGITGMSGFGRNAMGYGNNFMNAGSAFAQNTQDLYDRAGRRTLDDAINYATSSPQAQSLIDAAMRNDRRRLEEQALPGINQAASATNNTNSSRAGVADALANRNYDERRDQVATNVYKDLTNQYLSSNQTDFNNLMRANQGLADTFGVGMRLAPAASDALTNAGGMLQLDSQGQLDANRDAFERQRDFRMNQLGTFASLLGGLPSTGSIRPNMANPYTATLSGAMMGGGFGSKIADYFNQPSQSAQPAIGYGRGFGTATPYIPAGL